jgi:hypothetical protein
MLTTLLILTGLIAAFLAFAATRPDRFSVTRSARIEAPPHALFPLINDWRHWEDWSPYERKDPDMKRTYSGAARGAGAVYEFEGNRNVGKGRLEILESAPPSRIAISLEMLGPCKGNNLIDFTLRPDGDGTHVTWAMRGTSSYVGKVMGLIFNLDRMIGGDFDAGLRNLKSLAERPLPYGTLQTSS